MPPETTTPITHPNLRTLIIDNYDSYTFNLYQYCFPVALPAADSRVPVVIRNDQFSWFYVEQHLLPHFDCIVISPGPGRPERPDDFGICEQVLQYASHIPILGVCLGHQGMASVFGGSVIQAPEPVHGRLSPVHYIDRPDKAGSTQLFDSLPNPFQAVRYHSLVVAADDLPPCLRVTATTTEASGDCIIQALEHVDRPMWGVQFHPESICTEGGQQIIHNFLRMAAEFHTKVPILILHTQPYPFHVHSISIISTPLPSPVPTTSRFETVVLKLDGPYIDAVRVFDAFYKEEEVAFWLDSAKVDKEKSRFSYMGSMSSSMSFSVKYESPTRHVSISHPQSASHPLIPQSETLRQDDTFFGWMSRTLDTFGMNSVPVVPYSQQFEIPFPFHCGMVGYFGYEMKAEAMASRRGASHRQTHFDVLGAEDTPDAAFMLADRVLVFDHIERQMYIMGLRDTAWESDTCREWIEETARRMTELQLREKQIEATIRPMATDTTYTLRPLNPRTSYINNIHSSLAHIRSGESYELCLTTQLVSPLPPSTSQTHIYNTYLHMRTRNPAPYAAFLRWDSSLTLTSSSPELFLSLSSTGHVSMKPIKGTLPVATTQTHPSLSLPALASLNASLVTQLSTDEKTRAENLMIVDLIRHDLNGVCVGGSVAVQKLMQVESYATVHQLVTTCGGQVAVGSVDVLKECFPPGSMTGAPKLRSLHLLESLESTINKPIPRGPYAGTLGYFSLTGPTSFSVIIRTAVFTPHQVRIGAGGAIVMMSDPDEEWDEVGVKAGSVWPRYV
ncbi:ADC synthase [Phlyctochytrium arcticum]|nr:ADC synthase [Phlyctochytrium arcticum]